MSTEPAVTVPAEIWRKAAQADPARPLITFYDDATGERMELSVASFGNWVAKTANLFQDNGVESGSTVAILLPAHWQSAAIAVAAWSVGLRVSIADAAGADIVFCTVDNTEHPEADEVYVLSLAPFALPVRDVPAGTSDYASEVRVHGDHFRPLSTVDGTAPALMEAGHEFTGTDLTQAAFARAAELGLNAADRVLAFPGLGILDWLLAPLAAGASIVLVRNPDLSRLAGRMEAERVTSTIGGS